jgi:hypothetical protein
MTIFRSVSVARGKLFGSIGTVHLAYAETGSFPTQNILSAPFRCGQIYAGQQPARVNHRETPGMGI